MEVERKNTKRDQPKYVIEHYQLEDIENLLRVMNVNRIEWVCQMYKK